MTHAITLTHLNIRQSIAILLAKLIVADIIFGIILIGFYFLLVSSESFGIHISNNTILFLSVFISVGIIKVIISSYIVLSWLNEYYEIKPEVIEHKRGIIFRSTERYDLDKVRRVDIQDTFFGELFNYATLTLYDIRLNKYLDMYLIHNPDRYAKVLKTLRPDLEMKTDKIRLPFMPKREDLETD